MKQTTADKLTMAGFALLIALWLLSISGCATLKHDDPIPMREIPVTFLKDTMVSRWDSCYYKPIRQFIYIDQNLTKWQLPSFRGPYFLMTNFK